MIAPPLPDHPVLLPDDAIAAARFEDLLELRSRAALLGLRDLHEAYTERIVDELCPDGFDGPGHGGAACA
mgnify:CR=1 FL=1